MSLAADLLTCIATPAPSAELLELVETRMAAHLVARRATAAQSVFAAVRDEPRRFVTRGRESDNPLVTQRRRHRA